MLWAIIALGVIATGSTSTISYASALSTLTPTAPTSWPVISPDNARRITLLAKLESQEQYFWVVGIAFSPDSDLLATIDFWGTVVLWDARTASELSLLKPPNLVEPGNANKVVFSPDGKLLVSSNLSDILIWDVETVLTDPDSPPKIILRGHAKRVYALQFSPDGTLLASSDATLTPDEHNTVRIWEVSTGRVVMQTKGFSFGVCCLRFGSDGDTFSWGERKDYWEGEVTTHVWSIKAQREIEEINDHLFLLSPDGKTKLVWASMPDGRKAIELQDVETGEVKVTLQNNGLGVGLPIGRIAAFSPDGTILATGDTSDAGMVSIYGKWKAVNY
jgi:WD40 repeat protein